MGKFLTHEHHVCKKLTMEIFPYMFHVHSKKKGHDELPFRVVNQVKSPLNSVLLRHNFHFPSFYVDSIKKRSRRFIGMGRQTTEHKKWLKPMFLQTLFLSNNARWKCRLRASIWDKGRRVFVVNCVNFYDFSHPWFLLLTVQCTQSSSFNSFLNKSGARTIE